MHFDEIIMMCGRVAEGIGVAIILFGTLIVLASHGIAVLRDRAARADHYRSMRRGIGKALLLGLEVLVAGDIIRTVALEPTLRAALTLGIIVIIRTFLSWSIELETDGRWPWQKESS